MSDTRGANTVKRGNSERPRNDRLDSPSRTSREKAGKLVTVPVPVWPREPLLARRDERYWWVNVPTPHNATAALGQFTDGEFAAAFMPAALITDVIDAVRDIQRHGGYNGESRDFWMAVDTACAALAAFDAEMTP